MPWGRGRARKGCWEGSDDMLEFAVAGSPPEGSCHMGSFLVCFHAIGREPGKETSCCFLRNMLQIGLPKCNAGCMTSKCGVFQTQREVTNGLSVPRAVPEYMELSLWDPGFLLSRAPSPHTMYICESDSARLDPGSVFASCEMRSRLPTPHPCPPPAKSNNNYFPG